MIFQALEPSRGKEGPVPPPPYHYECQFTIVCFPFCTVSVSLGGCLTPPPPPPLPPPPPTPTPPPRLTPQKIHTWIRTYFHANIKVPLTEMHLCTINHVFSLPLIWENLTRLSRSVTQEGKDDHTQSQHGWFCVRCPSHGLLTVLVYNPTDHQKVL